MSTDSNEQLHELLRGIAVSLKTINANLEHLTGAVEGVAESIEKAHEPEGDLGVHLVASLKDLTSALHKRAQQERSQQPQQQRSQNNQGRRDDRRDRHQQGQGRQEETRHEHREETLHEEEIEGDSRRDDSFREPRDMNPVESGVEATNTTPVKEQPQDTPARKGGRNRRSGRRGEKSAPQQPASSD